MPDRFWHRGVSSHDATDPFDWPEVFFTALTDFALHVPVPHPAPQSPHPGEVARIVASSNPSSRSFHLACTGQAWTSPTAPCLVSTRAQNLSPHNTLIQARALWFGRLGIPPLSAVHLPERPRVFVPDAPARWRALS